MPLLIPLLSGVASFFGGAYIGTVINEANEAPSTVIEAESVTATQTTASGFTKKDLVFYGLLGLGALLLYKKLK